MEAILAAVVHDDGTDEHGEEDGGDHGLLLACEGEGTREGGEAIAEGVGVLPLAHSKKPEFKPRISRICTDGIMHIREIGENRG